MQDLPSWAEPKEYTPEQNRPNCESVCNPTNSGNAGKVCGCQPNDNPDVVPIPIFPLFIIALIYGLWKIKN